MKIRNTRIELVKIGIYPARSAFKIPAVKFLSEIKIRNYYRQALIQAVRKKNDFAVIEVSENELDESCRKAAAKIIAQEIFRHAHEQSPGLKRIIIRAADNRARAVFRRYALDYLDYISHKLQSPFLTVDAIIEIAGGIVVIKRSNPPFGWALPGGFVDYGESLEEAVVREAKEETGLDITGIKQFHTYSKPGRDPRFHTVATVFIAQAKGRPKAGDDAADLAVVQLSEIKKRSFAFDHKKIIQDYIRKKAGAYTFAPPKAGLSISL